MSLLSSSPLVIFSSCHLLLLSSSPLAPLVAGSRVQEHLKDVALGKKEAEGLSDDMLPNVVVIHNNKVRWNRLHTAYGNYHVCSTTCMSHASHEFWIILFKLSDFLYSVN